MEKIDIPILIIDPDSKFSLEFEKEIHKQGYPWVQSAPSARQAVQLLDSQEFRFIFSAIDLPQASGIALLKFIKFQKKFQKLRFYLVMKESEVKSRNHSEATVLGLDGYLTKPIQPTLLSSVLLAGSVKL